MQRILVVNTDGEERIGLLRALNAAGYRAVGASTFDEAKRWLDGRALDLVIADERLGAYNGLHVIVRARAVRPDVRAIVTSPVANSGLEADARHLNVCCLIKPDDPAKWLAPIARTLKARLRARRRHPSGLRLLRRDRSELGLGHQRSQTVIDCARGD